MNRIMTLVVCFVAMASLGFTAEVRGDYAFNVDGGMAVGSDFMSGNTWGYGGGQNAVVTGINTYTDMHLHPDEGVFVCHVNTTVSGVWGNPNDSNPWYDMLEDGIFSHTSTSWTQVYYNGEYWQFDQVVAMSTFTSANLQFGDFDDSGSLDMWGSASNSAIGVGMIPTENRVYIDIYQPGHPSWLPDWQMLITSTWQVTSDFHLVPAPGAIALLGLGGLGGISSRRRRS